MDCAPEAESMLKGLNLKALQRLAIDRGFSAEEIDRCGDELDMKSALIELISTKAAEVEAEKEAEAMKSEAERIALAATEAEQERSERLDPQAQVAAVPAVEQAMKSEVATEEKPIENDDAEGASCDQVLPRFHTATKEDNLVIHRFDTANETSLEEAVGSSTPKDTVEKQQFESMTVGVLKKVAKEKGASAEDLEKCEDALDFKRALIDLIRSKDSVVGGEAEATSCAEGGNNKDCTTFSKVKAKNVEPPVPRKESDSAVYLAALSRLNAQLGKNPSIKKLSDHTRVPPLGVASIAALVVLSYTIYGLFGQLVSTFFGVVVPGYYSFKAVEDFSELAIDSTELRAKASGMRFWVIYWVVLAVFMTAEYFTYGLLSWLPLYQPLKLSILLWLYLPQTRGANFVYHWFVAPTLRRNQHRIDGALEQSGNQLKAGVKNALGDAVDTSFGGMQALRRSVTDLGFAAIKKLT
jgi:receptor expression-enhancing protein 5/6